MLYRFEIREIRKIVNLLNTRRQNRSRFTFPPFPPPPPSFWRNFLFTPLMCERPFVQGPEQRERRARVGRVAMETIPDEVFGGGDSVVLHRVRRRVRGRLRGQHVGGVGCLQEREDALVTHQHIHRQPGRSRPACHCGLRAVHAHREHYHR